MDWSKSWLPQACIISIHLGKFLEGKIHQNQTGTQLSCSYYVLPSISELRPVAIPTSETIAVMLNRDHAVFMGFIFYIIRLQESFMKVVVDTQ